MKEAIITITIGTIIGGTIGAILYKILCSDCTPYIITFQKGIEKMQLAIDVFTDMMTSKEIYIIIGACIIMWIALEWMDR